MGRKSKPSTDLVSDSLVQEVVHPEEIAEPLVFKLAYLEERKSHLTNLTMLRNRVFEERLTQIKHERRVEMEQIEKESLRINEALKALREEIEAKHNIKLSEYAYNDESGILVRIPGKSDMKENEHGTA